jgi:cobalt-zinc-cadmium resistance protein CzcA
MAGDRRAPVERSKIKGIGDVVISTRGSVPVRVRDVAQVVIGGEIRTGSASENGHEVVVGTALMLIGSNSRTVAAAVDAKIDQVRRTLPAGIELKTVLNRTQLVDATVRTVVTNLGEALFGDPRVVRVVGIFAASSPRL